MVILVCGGRTYNNKDKVNEVLSSIHKEKPITVLIHGAAKGADTLAEYWARENGIKEKQYPALWNTHGKAAGSIRNQQMLDSNTVELVIAFPGGKGTADMLDRAKKSGIEVKEIKVKPYVVSFIDCSATSHDSFEVSYSIIKNGIKKRDCLPGGSASINNSFEEVTFEYYKGLCSRLFDPHTYRNFLVPRFSSKDVCVQSMGIYSLSGESIYRKYGFEGCSFDFSKADTKKNNVFIKEISCTKMLTTPIWAYVDKELLNNLDYEIYIFTTSINRENTPTMCSLILTPSVEGDSK